LAGGGLAVRAERQRDVHGDAADLGERLTEFGKVGEPLLGLRNVMAGSNPQPPLRALEVPALQIGQSEVAGDLGERSLSNQELG
jgi:hypothetical protein